MVEAVYVWLKSLVHLALVVRCVELPVEYSELMGLVLGLTRYVYRRSRLAYVVGAVEEYEIPEKLDREALWKVYMLHKSQCLLHCVPNPRTKNCRDNPYCLERLGSEKWEKLVQKMEKEGKTSEKSNSRREVTVMPCGLVNLGNSCYLNSFLQVRSAMFCSSHPAL
ncbi:unnamed protein product [Toxocara canis]|uniref:USP domain-containing protein n=1 Tax=Toxocara canis TaxID=6265 RepID=A0A183TZR1_TOXCA|nr:unnamed protein product [Toxocara canis]